MVHPQSSYYSTFSIWLLAHHTLLFIFVSHCNLLFSLLFLVLSLSTQLLKIRGSQCSVFRIFFFYIYIHSLGGSPTAMALNIIHLLVALKCTSLSWTTLLNLVSHISNACHITLDVCEILKTYSGLFPRFLALCS